MTARRQTIPALPPAVEACALLCVPVAMLVLPLAGVESTAGPTLLACALALALGLAGFERSRPALRQLMPTAVLAAVAAAGRVLFAPVPDVKPVSAVAILAGAVLGRRSGFVVGALAALASNFFFGQGAWTPWQMYAWGMVGYVGGMIGDGGRGEGRTPALRTWALLSGLFYGLVLNGYYVLGYVRPLTWPAVLAAFGAGLPLDVVHGVATLAFFCVVWGPWRRAILRVVARYGLDGSEGPGAPA